MSLLTHSLMAVMLLAAVTAGPCSELDIGTPSSSQVNPEPEAYDFSSGAIKIRPGICQEHNFTNEPSGWHISACNNDTYPAPDLALPPTGHLDPVDFTCTAPCPNGITVTTIIYC